MKITKINKTDSKVTIYFDKEKLEFYPATYASYHLYINKIIEESELSKMKEDNKIEEYFLYATKRLILTSYSPSKIEEFLLKKGANKTQIKKVIEKLRKYDFINESKMVEEIISFCDSKHYGFYRIIKMLNDKKISKEEIAKVEYNSIREKKECELQVKLLQNKYKNKNEFNRKKSIYSALLRYGFDESISLELVNKFSNSNHFHEINVLKLDYQKCFSKFSRKYTGYELSQKITVSLLSKGYRINDINYVKELQK
ncbi:MAG: RecX family transcriptional regulator [Firmicutes bacterium]|nr:RecX family transcriptional regulator [Candidatus Fiminaster equi]